MSFAIAGTVLTVGATAYGANRANSASRAQQRGADAATAESARQYDQARDDFAPWRSAGVNALDELSSMLGLPIEARGGYFDAATYLAQNPDVAADQWASQNPQEHWERFGQHEGRQRPFIGGTPARSGGDPNANFFASPDYNFRRTEGTRGIERSAAARGGAFSGNALRALTEFNSNLASQEFGNRFNRLAGVAGIGQTATNQTAAYGADHAANAGRNAMYAGNARASGIENTANIIGSGINGLSSIWGYYNQNKAPKAWSGPR